MDSPIPGKDDAATGASGRTVGNRYILGATVGSGGMGTVWRAYDQLLHRDVAVKEVLLPPGLPAPERKVLCERTLREARAAAALNHPAVVRVYDVVQDGERPWIVMELLEARNISEILRDDGPMSVRKVAEVGLAVLGALEAAHRIGVLHRDVKPGNVLIGADGRTTLTDFGVARSANESPLTSTGLLLGSPQYIAPERARGQQFGPASDLWSLGATLYTAVEGRPPFDRGDPLPTMTAVVCEPPDPITFAGPLAPILDGLMEKDPAKRWDTPRTRAALKIVLSGGTVPSPTPEPVSPPPQGKPASPARRPLSSRLASAVAHRSPMRAHDSGGELEATGAMEAPVFTDSQPRVGADGLPVSPAGGRAARRGANAAPSARTYSPPPPPPMAPPAPPQQARPSALAPPPAATRMMPGMPAPQQQPAAATQMIGAQPPQEAAKPRRSVYLESPEAMRASAAGETAGIPRPPAAPDRRRLLIFGVIALVVVLIAGIGTYALAQLGQDTPDSVWVSSEKPATQAKLELTPFEHTKGGFKTVVPKDWKPQWTENHDRVKFYDSTGAMYLQLYAVKANGATQEQIWNGGEGYQKRQLKQYKRVSFKPSRIAGKEALDWEFSYFNAKENVTRRILDRGIVINNISYQLYFTAPEDRFEQNAKLLDEVSKNFALIN